MRIKYDNQMRIIACVVFLCACSPQQFGVTPEKEVFAQQVTYNKQVDVLWVVDSSGSMGPRQSLLADQVQPFIDALNGTQLDYHIAVISTDMSVNGQGGRFLTNGQMFPVLDANTPNLTALLKSRLEIGDTGSPVTRGLEAMKASLTAPNTDFYNSGFLRQNAMLAVLFLTDKDDSSATADYGGFLDQLKPPLASGERSWLAHVLAVLPADDQCLSAPWSLKIPALKYIDLANRSGGISASICAPDFRETMTNIRARILEIITEYKLARKPSLATIHVYINSVEVPQDPHNGWQYNATQNSIRFYGTAVPIAGTPIRVDFTPSELQ